MKSTGILRKTDELGRITIPVELRRLFEIKDNSDLLEIFVESDTICLRKYRSDCVFCGITDSLTEYMGRYICASCLEKLAAEREDG